MPLYLENANDVLLNKVRLNLDKQVSVEGASFLLTLCEQNNVDITGVTSNANAEITLSADIGLEASDEVLIRRVRGAIAANELFVVASVDSLNFTIPADTAIQTYVDGGQAWKVVIKDLEFTYDKANDQYYCVLHDTLQLKPATKYMLFIECEDLEVRIEFEDTANIRTK